MSKITKIEETKELEEIKELKQEVVKTLVGREGFENALLNITFQGSNRYTRYIFWGGVVAKMRIVIDKKSVPTAGAGFENGAYVLYFNEDFYNNLPLSQRIGIIIHEALHVVLQHLHRQGERDQKLFNYAADMALNQEIERDMLPDGAIYPDSFKDPEGQSYPDGKTAEFYYNLLKEEQKNQEQEKGEQENQDDQDGEDQDGEGEGEGQEGQGSGFQPSNGNPDLTKGSEEGTFDDHSKWEEMSEDDIEQGKQVMEKILENAMEKSRGNAPGFMNQVMELWRKKPVISWKKVLKRYLSSRVGYKENTIKKRDRRQQHRKDLKGKRSRTNAPEVIVAIDTSGSMSDEEIANGLVEINEVCRLTKANLKLLQVDTVIQGLEEYDPKKKTFTRKGCGGTYMGAAAEYLTTEKIHCDVLVFISDMYIEDIASDKNWQAYKSPVLWLNTSGTDVPSVKRHKVMDISKA